MLALENHQYRSGVPRVNILIERLSLIEHTAHIVDGAGVDIREVTFGEASSDVIFGEGTLCKNYRFICLISDIVTNSQNGLCWLS
jgi:hypothetical protein